MAVIEWDIARMEELVEKLDLVIAALEAQHNKIKQLAAQAGGAWQSMAGSEYAERIDEDLSYIEETIESYNQVRINLNESKKIYAGCELDISTKLMEYYNAMSVSV